MTEFRGDKMSLFLFLLLPFTAVTGYNPLRIVARDGGEVTLPSKNGLYYQDTCDRTSWLFNVRDLPSVNLITDGKMKENPKSDRLNFTENCSLVIKKVTAEDVGYYTCRESGQDTNVYLYLINITEHENNDKVTLTCSVLRLEGCDHTVKWLYEGKDVDEDDKDIKTSPSECSVTVTFPASLLKQSEHLKSTYHELFECQVTDSHTNKAVSFSPEKPGEEATTATTTTTTTATTTTTTLTAGTTEDSNETRISSTRPEKDDWWLYIAVAGGAALVVLVIIIVVAIRCKRTTGKKAQMDENAGQPLNPGVAESAPETSQNTADPDDGVSYASVSFIKRTKKAKVKNDEDEDEGDAVTYSTVRASSSAAAACDDPSSLYAAIKKPNK